MSDIILHEHPSYKTQRVDWDLCTKLFEAKHSVVCVDPEIFWRHAVEEGINADNAVATVMTNIAKSQFARRSRRTRWLNLPEIVSSLLISFIFREQPDFSDVEDLFREDINNVDGKGNSLYSFIKNSFALDYLKYGKAIIKVESTTHSAITIADEIGAGVRPYFTLINPLNLPDWEVSDGKGINNFNWLRYEYDRVKNRARANDEPKRERISKVYYNQGGKVLVESYASDIESNVEVKSNYNFTLREQGELGLSRIPFVVLEDVSWLKDVNQEALRFHNLRSSRDNILYSQGYQKVVVFGLDPSDPNQLQAMSETTWNLVRDPTGSVQAIEPPDLSSHEKAIEESLNNIFKVGLNQLRILPSDSRVAQGADSLAEEKDNTVALIESTLEDIENAMNEAISIYAEYKGIKDYDKKIEIEKKYTKEDVNKFVTVFNSFRDQFRNYPTVMKHATKKAVKELGFEEDDLNEALSEVDKGIIEEVNENDLMLDEENEESGQPSKQNGKASPEA